MGILAGIGGRFAATELLAMSGFAATGIGFGALLVGGLVSLGVSALM